MVTFLFGVASAVCELGRIVLTLFSLTLFIDGQTVHWYCEPYRAFVRMKT